METILVAGGAGYIGSHMVALLVERGYDVVVVDNLSTGHAQAVKGARFYEGDLRDGDFLEKVFSENRIHGVINFAAFSLVAESVADPLKYYNNNVGGATGILTAMKNHGVKRIVFSSTAATYGEPEKQPIEESDRTHPINPYGGSKLAIEGLLRWCDEAYGIKYAALRYFTAAGANTDAGIGEDHHPETHLIPIVLQCALGKRDHVGIFGDDYPTPDGSCIRDYIDVTDLAKAHVAAIGRMVNGKSKSEYEVFNIGTGRGVSVLELVKGFERVNGVKLNYRIAPRRAGDIIAIWADPTLANTELGWKAERPLDETLASAWKWQQSLK